MGVIEDYVNQFSELKRAWIAEYTEYMKEKHPELEAIIWLRMPCYRRNNTYLAFSVTKHYFAVHTNDKECFLMLQQGLDKASFGKRSARIKFTDDGAKHVIYNVIEYFCYKGNKPMENEDVSQTNEVILFPGSENENIESE